MPHNIWANLYSRLADMATCDWKGGCDSEAASEHHWCKFHKAEYQRTWRQTQEEMLQWRAFARGVAAFRQDVCGTLMRMPMAQFSGQAVAKWIWDRPLPTFENNYKNS